MSKPDIAEMILILLVSLGALLAAPLLPSETSIGHLLLTLSALLLLQSLIRDLFILARTKRAAQAGARAPMRCLCMESAVGITGVLAGAVVIGFGIGTPAPMSGWSWALAVLLALGVGFAIKDFVLQTKPWGIVRDKDHVNIVVSWKQP